MDLSSESLRVSATDGFALSASWFGPVEPERVVLVAPATGVRRRLYDAFGRFLAERGFGTLTWDWRGTGGSRPARLQGFEGSMRDWAERDLAGAISWATERFPSARLYGVGHSFGGQAVGLASNARRLRGLVTVAAQSGYWGHWPRPQRYGYALLWHAAVPLLTRLFGYYPARRLGMGEDLPREVALQWARWCRTPEYLGDYRGHASFSAPILALSFSDDPFAPLEAVEALHAHYGSPELLHRHVEPGDVGAERIGHFGFFREGLVPTLWQDVATWLEQHDAAGAA